MILQSLDQIISLILIFYVDLGFKIAIRIIIFWKLPSIDNAKFVSSTLRLKTVNREAYILIFLLTKTECTNCLECSIAVLRFISLLLLIPPIHSSYI